MPAGLGHRVAAAAARVPVVARLLHSGARWIGGRHHVAAVGAVLRDRQVLLAAHRFRGGAWALPGGWVRPFEDPYRAVEREVAEETALRVRAAEVVGCERHGDGRGQIPYSGLTIAFRCELDGDQVADMSAELLEIRWATVHDAAALLSDFEQDVVVTALRRAEESTRAAGPVPASDRPCRPPAGPGRGSSTSG